MTNDIRVHGIPEPLLGWLSEQARLHQRSIEREVIAVLETARLDEVCAPRSTVTLDELLAFRREVAALPTLSVVSEEETLGIDSMTGLPH